MFISIAAIFRRALIFVLCIFPPVVATVCFAQEASDLKPDPAARFGALENGLHYVILPYGEPDWPVSLGLMLRAGARHEDNNQRGAAQLLASAVSNRGSLRHYAGYDHTEYRLELPDTSEDSLVTGLRSLAEVVGEVPRIADRAGVPDYQVEQFYSDAVRSRHFVLQLLQGPADFSLRPRVEEFWETWYRPENSVVVFVGEADVAMVEQAIAAAFASLKSLVSVSPEPELGAIPEFDGVRFVHFFESEASATRVSFLCLSASDPVPDTIVNRVNSLPRQLALAMLNRRYADLVKGPAAPFGQATAVVMERFGFVRAASVELFCPPEGWRRALAAGEQELRRALEHGFEREELEEAVAAAVRDLEHAAATALSHSVGSLADMVMTSIAAGEVLVAPSDLLAVLKPALYGVTLGDCARALASVFPGTGLHVVISGHAKIAGDAVAAIETAYEESRVVAVLTRAAERSRAWAYTDFGPPGAVTKREYVEDLDIIQLTYANGVRVNLKQTDFDPGRIMVSARVGSGSITEPPDQRGLAQIAGSVFNGGALGRHSRDDLRRILAGRNAGVALQVMTDALVFAYPTFSNVRGPSGTGATGTTREDLLLTLQLFAAHLSDPGYRPEGFRQNQQTLGLIYGSINQVHGPLAMEVSNLIAGGDSRFGLPPREVIMARTIDEVRAWLSPQLAHGAIEVAIVGDFDVDATIDAVAQTLGALPTREPPLALADLRTVSFPASPFTKSYAVSSQIPQGLVLLYWPTSDGIDAQFDQRLSLLARVYGDRLRAKLRDEGGGPEGPRVQSVTSETYPGYGYLFASVDVEFSAADKIAEAAIAIAHDLATTGVTEEDLDCVRLSMLSTAVQALGDNAHWLGRVLARAQEKPAVLDWERMRIRDLENITVEEVNTLAQRYLGRDQVSRVTIMPAE